MFRADLWGRWQLAMRAAGLRDSTVTSRATTWRSWAPWIGDRLWTADHRDVEVWIAERQLGNAAANRAVSDLAQFYRWAMRDGLCEHDPTELAARPRKRPGHPRPVPVEVVAAALASPDRRLARTTALMAYGGLRCGEVSRLTAGGIDWSAGVLWIDGKGGRGRVAALVDPMRPYLASLDGAPADTPVFARADGRPGPASPARISQLMSEHLTGCAGGVRTTAHQLRHTFAGELLARSGDLELVQQALGHSSIATTQVYARGPHSVARIAAAFAK